MLQIEMQHTLSLIMMEVENACTGWRDTCLTSMMMGRGINMIPLEKESRNNKANGRIINMSRIHDYKHLQRIWEEDPLGKGTPPP